jgi:hypothetical protein
MVWQIMTELDTRPEANAVQPEIFGQPTTDFFGIQHIPRSWEMTLTEQESPSIYVSRERTSAEILDEVFKDFAEAWKRLADL